MQNKQNYTCNLAYLLLLNKTSISLVTYFEYAWCIYLNTSCLHFPSPVVPLIPPLPLPPRSPSPLAPSLSLSYTLQSVHGQGSNFTNGVLVISCSQDLLTRLIFPDVLLLVAYVWGLYVFRFGAPEHLISLVETVFLGSQHIRNGQSKMVYFMR